MNRSEFERLRIGHVKDEDLAIPDPARSGGANDMIRRFRRPLIADPDTYLNLGQESTAVFAADVAVQVALLTAVSLGLAYHAGDNLEIGDRTQDGLRTEGLENDRELLHDSPAPPFLC